MTITPLIISTYLLCDGFHLFHNIFIYKEYSQINKCKRNNERQQNFLDLRFYFFSTIFNHLCVSKIKNKSN